VIRELDPDLPLAEVSTIDTLIEASLAPRRLGVMLLAAFSIVATALACLGVYGHLAFMVSRRETHRPSSGWTTSPTTRGSTRS
jgi:hypothetical protein